MACFPVVGLLRLTNCTPRKSNPSVKRVSRVFSRLSVRSIRLAIASKAARAGFALLRHTRSASRVKEWLHDGRRGLSVAAGFPGAVPHEPGPGQLTIPFPSHRTFSFPEYGGPTVFTVHRAQVSPCTPACRCRYREAPSHTACYSDSVSTRTPGLCFSGSSSDESEC